MRVALALALLMAIVTVLPLHGSVGAPAQAPLAVAPQPVSFAPPPFAAPAAQCVQTSSASPSPHSLINVPAAGTGASATYDIAQLTNNTAVNATVTAPSGASLDSNEDQFILLGVGVPVNATKFTAVGVAETGTLLGTLTAPVAYLPNGTIIFNIGNTVSQGSSETYQIAHVHGWWWTYSYNGNPITGSTTSGTAIPWENGTYDLGTPQALGVMCESGYRVGPSFVAILYHTGTASMPSLPTTSVPWAVGVETTGSSSPSYVPLAANAMPQFNASLGIVGIQSHAQSSSIPIDHLVVGSGVPFPGAFAPLWGNFKVVTLNTSSVTPISASLAYNGTQFFNTTSLDQNGAFLPGVHYSWQISPASLGKLNTTTGSTATLTAGATTVSGRLWVNMTFNCSTHVNVANITVTKTGGPSVLSFGASPSSLMLGASTNLTVVNGSWPRPITYTYTGLPIGCSSTNATLLVCTPTSTGTYNVRVYLNDTLGHSSTALTPLNVYPDLAISTFSASPNPLTNDTLTHVNVAANGGIPPLIYNFEGLPTGCANGNQPSAFQCVPTHFGTYTVRVFVNDSAGHSVNATLTLHVNIQLSVTGFAASPGAIPYGGTTFLNVTASGGTPPYSYTFSQLPLGCTSSNTTSLSCVPTVSGNFLVRVNVTDSSGAVASGGAPLTVNPPPVPVIAQYKATPDPVNVSQTTTISTVATGGSGALSYAYSGLPNGCATSDTASLPCVPTLAGTFTVTVEVKDTASHSAWGNLTLTVDAVGSPIVLSTFTATPSSITVGATSTLAATATGGSGALAYTYTGLPAGCTSSSAASFGCTPTATGTFTLRVYVNDTGGHSATLTTTLTVNPGQGAQSSLLGSMLPFLLIAVIAVVAVVVAVVLVRKRKKGPAPAAPPPQSWEPPPQQAPGPGPYASEPPYGGPMPPPQG